MNMNMNMKVTNLLDSNPLYVVDVALDFSKAFDTVRHCCLVHGEGGATECTRLQLVN